MSMHFEGQSSQTSYAVKHSNLGIEKPPRLKGVCPIEIHDEHLPDLEKLQKPTQYDRNSKTKNKKSSKVLVKSKVNLPKLKSKEFPQQRLDAGEPHGDQHVLPKFTVCKGQPAVNLEKTSKTPCTVQLKNNEVFEKSVLQDFRTSPNPGPSECKVLFNVPDSEINADDFNIEDKDLEESKALKRWEFWMRDKKRQQKHLSRRLRTSSGHLQIQESDKYRQIVEDKLLLEYCQHPKADKWRGHPYRWKAKVRLGNGNKTELNVAQYTGVKTEIQEGKLPKMQFIGIPKPVQLEKGITSGLKNIAMTKLEKMPHRQQQISYFNKQIKQLKPHDIDMDNLVVIGEKIPKPQQGASPEDVICPNLPEIQIEAENDELNPFDCRKSVFCLAIQGEEVKYELQADCCQNPDKVFKWVVDFGVNTVGSLVERVMRIENKGTVTVAYNWLSQKKSVDSTEPKHHEPWFFFNKNSGFFLPGQVYDIKVYHKAETYGIRKEIWHLQTMPPLSKNPCDASVVLSAIATEDFLVKNNDFESYLSKRVGSSVAAFALEVILYKVFNYERDQREIEYRSIFFEKELFEYQNPKYYYHSSVVRDLKEVFKQIPQKKQLEWDLSLNTLASLIQTFVTENEKSTLFSSVVSSAKKLLKPNYLRMKNSKTYKMSYEILCEMANFMEEDYDYIRNLLSQRKENLTGKTCSDDKATQQTTSSSSLVTEETSEFESNKIMVFREINPSNYFFFQMMLYHKVYHRICEAVEHIVGIFETSKLFKPWKEVNQKLEKPSRNIRCSIKSCVHLIVHFEAELEDLRDREKNRNFSGGQFVKMFKQILPMSTKKVNKMYSFFTILY